MDKRLDGVQAVQTLSRLNRMIPGKDAPFVLDFVNDAEDIYRAFKPYYDKTELQESVRPGAARDAEARARPGAGLPLERGRGLRPGLLQADGAAESGRSRPHAAAPAAGRGSLQGVEEEEKRQEFRDKLSGYVKVYAFLSQIIPYADPDLEMLYSFGRFLLPHLPVDRDAAIIKLGDEVELQYYRLERIFSGAIEVREGDAQYVKSPTDVGTGKAKDEKAPLSEIIEVLNERFGTQFTEEDRLFFQQIKERAVQDDRVVQTALANPLDKFELGIRKLIEDLMIAAHGGQRQDRHALHGRSRVPGIGVPHPGEGDLRGGESGGRHAEPRSVHPARSSRGQCWWLMDSQDTNAEGRRCLALFATQR